LLYGAPAPPFDKQPGSQDSDVRNRESGLKMLGVRIF
jgi:hypothetical protein